MPFVDAVCRCHLSMPFVDAICRSLLCYQGSADQLLITYNLLYKTILRRRWRERPAQISAIKQFSQSGELELILNEDLIVQFW